MTHTQRAARNLSRLADDCHPVFAARVRRLISQLEAAGLRPRIQDAWRSPKAQLAAYQAGTSTLKWGLHCATNPDGDPAALAVDLLDDRAPLAPGTAYLLRLAATAEACGLRTGIRWGLPASLRRAIDVAIAHGAWSTALKVGWDPCHIEPADCPSISAARAGWRPM